VIKDMIEKHPKLQFEPAGTTEIDVREWLAAHKENT
jgi:hypothetical protein